MSFHHSNSMSPHQLDEAKDQGLARGHGTKMSARCAWAAGVYSMAIEAAVSTLSSQALILTWHPESESL